MLVVPGRRVGLVFVGILLFLLCYFDEQALFGAKIGVLWRGLLTVLLAASCLMRSANGLLPLTAVGILVVIKGLIYHYHSVEYLIADVLELSKFMVLPLVVQFLWASRTEGRQTNIYIARFLAFWIPLTVVPFLFGLPEIERSQSYNLERFGVADAFGFAGVFGNTTVACVTLASCILLLLWLKDKKVISLASCVILSGLCAVGMYKSYSRSGMLALLLTLLYVALTGPRQRVVGVMRAVALVSVVSALAAALYFHDQVFAFRLTGKDIYSQGDGSLEQLGSGRTRFWQAALQNPWENGVPSALFGHGLQYSMDLMERDVGLRIFSHNGFLDAYQTSGIIGFGLFVAFYLCLHRHIANRLPGSDRTFAFAAFWFNVFVQLTQGGFFFWTSVIFAVLLVGSGRGLPTYRSRRVKTLNASGTL